MSPLSLSSLSGRYLSFAEREETALLKAQGKGVREIARAVGRDASTISLPAASRSQQHAGQQEERGDQRDRLSAERGPCPIEHRSHPLDVTNACPTMTVWGYRTVDLCGSDRSLASLAGRLVLAGLVGPCRSSRSIRSSRSSSTTTALELSNR
ncbi:MULTISPECIES: helix-turn-helix domain-containing protein [unclassified Micromonospora]|uniref:helix-turn-helix domain-containing protein n=1 Tax=unclassified Micromonospora TaxID=2617518 RepID=UPI0036298892